jgi:hypothetical protein
LAALLVLPDNYILFDNKHESLKHSNFSSQPSFWSYTLQRLKGMPNNMITRKFFLFTLTAAASLYLVQGTSCNANDKSQFSGNVGAASVSASGLSLKADLETRVDDSQNAPQSRPVQNAAPEPVCHTHQDLDKKLITGGTDVLPM